MVASLLQFNYDRSEGEYLILNSVFGLLDSVTD